MFPLIHTQTRPPTNYDVSFDHISVTSCVHRVAPIYEIHVFPSQPLRVLPAESKDGVGDSTWLLEAQHASALLVMFAPPEQIIDPLSLVSGHSAQCRGYLVSRPTFLDSGFPMHVLFREY